MQQAAACVHLLHILMGSRGAGQQWQALCAGPAPVRCVQGAALPSACVHGDSLAPCAGSSPGTH